MKNTIRNFCITISSTILAILPVVALGQNQSADNAANVSDTLVIYPDALEMSDMDMMLDDWYFQMHSQTDWQCIESENPPRESDSVLISRLSKIPNIISMPFNQIVRTHIEFYTIKRRAFLAKALGLSAHYFPLFEAALEQDSLPLELKYLPVIESALNPSAVSRAGAAGLWQFMPQTAKLMGLEINSLVDERRDPIASTTAATRYLKELYNIYKDWSLVLAAYNCGPGNVNRAIRRAGGKQDYWAIYPYLPKETRGYVPSFIAANYAMHYYMEHEICPLVTYPAEKIDTVMVNNTVELELLSKSLNIPIERLCGLNPQYRQKIVPGHIKPYAIRLPLQSTLAYIDLPDSVLVSPRTTTPTSSVNTKTEVACNTTTHRVRSGETLGSIALKYGISVAKLKRDNNLKRDLINTGKILKINASDLAHNTSDIKKNNTSKHQSADTSKKSSNKYVRHTVNKGDTLWSIARQYPGVSSQNIIQANNLKGQNIKPGQVLKIPQV